MKKNFLKKVIYTLLTTFVTLTSTSFITKAVTNVGSYNAGVGIKNWPAQVNAPYVDMVGWVTKNGYYMGNDGGGAANLKRLSDETGIKYFNLAFIQSTGSVSNGKINWGWGGYSVLSEGKNDNQYNGIKQSLKDLRASGGDATISFGGASGTAFWQTSQDVNVLYNTYLDIVNGYALTRIDLDVEGGAQNKQSNIANAKAIKMLQDTTGVEVTLTVPVLPSGLTQTQIDLLDAYLSNNVSLKYINIMAMCYGGGTLLPGENYGTASLRAIDSTKNQIKEAYKKFANTTLSDSEAYSKVGVTVSVGYESPSDPIFTPTWSQLVADHAKTKNIGMTSYWSLNRDAQIENNQGIGSQYEHSKIFSKFGSPVIPSDNTAPVINGVTDKQINIGDTFNPLTGVTASDKEDGDLTSKIIVNGLVDTSKAGVYNISYTVSDSKSLSTTVSSTITVIDTSVQTYSPTKIYVAGDIVLYNGVMYKAKWWTQGETPRATQWGPWEKVS
ncbi:immunoglobulin-like domain-containing protein [Clostridium sp.]|uniref:immunoglobulin-like domain-containing protein n=1 Tax=Clostridium sp. TaxID=1506 RepID=UPI0025C0BCE1|nr:immunoglobulin-like domain-containing protein [Clostridium sp.]